MGLRTIPTAHWSKEVQMTVVREGDFCTDPPDASTSAFTWAANARMIHISVNRKTQRVVELCDATICRAQPNPQRRTGPQLR